MLMICMQCVDNAACTYTTGFPTCVAHWLLLLAGNIRLHDNGGIQGVLNMACSLAAMVRLSNAADPKAEQEQHYKHTSYKTPTHWFVSSCSFFTGKFLQHKHQ